jgi:hypothetical protein
MRNETSLEASCILASLQLSDYADPRVDDISVWLDLVVGSPDKSDKSQDNHQEEFSEA